MCVISVFIDLSYFIGLQLTPSSTVVMHLVMREQLPEPTNQGGVMISPLQIFINNRLWLTM